MNTSGFQFARTLTDKISFWYISSKCFLLPCRKGHFYRNTRRSLLFNGWSTCLFILVFTGCNGTPTTAPTLASSIKTDSIAPPVSPVKANPDAPFPWYAATDKNLLQNIPCIEAAFSRNAIPALDAFLSKKGKIWQHFFPEMKRYGLPDSSIFEEYLELDFPQNNTSRAVALWINNPQIRCNAPVCASSISGSVEMVGTETALLLLDPQNKKVLQRMDSIPDGWGGAGFYAPLLYQFNGLHQFSEIFRDTDDNVLGTATVLYPRDLDGDGQKAEFLFYYYEACGVYNCAILAYDFKQDRMVLRPFSLKITEPVPDKTGNESRDSVYQRNTNWVFDFPMDAVKPGGYIRYKKEVGHSSTTYYQYRLHYAPRKGIFEGEMKEIFYFE